ncbi:hypothetical protein CXB51_006559 [Gossypium anomalum]|uniref:Reverse transcriptase domain-containing protein n=1 Tax=Gossypium anomalum TaxID=47600 RepID=A0A8J5ZDG3_9ROSI|nr:hypothetical protein CXB51_006559 [Gossypium anomalum]
MAVKLDMSKAYDRVEWNFVGEIMNRMGFAQEWTNSIMKCMSNVSYTTVVNGSIGEIFYPTRGLRQGNPLSPFLFLICAEGLSCLMRLALRDGILKGVKEEDRQLVVHQLGVRISTDLERYLAAKFGSWGTYLHLPGGAFGQQRASFKMDFVGESAEVLRFLYGMIAGFQEVLQWGLVSNTFQLETAQKILQIPLVEHEDFQPPFGSNADLPLSPTTSVFELWRTGVFELWKEDRCIRTLEGWLFSLEVPLFGFDFNEAKELSGRFTSRNRIDFIYAIVYAILMHEGQRAVDGRFGATGQQGAEPQALDVPTTHVGGAITYMNRNIGEWLTWFFERGTKEQCRVFCCSLWFLWSYRNQFVHKRKNFTIRDLVKKIRSYLTELERIREKQLASFTESIHNQAGETTSVTVQFDAAFDKRNFRSASGLVVRDQRGEITAEKTTLHENISSSFVAEAHAGLEAIKLVISMGLSSVVIQGDSKTVIKKCQSQEIDKSVLGAIIRDIQSKRSSLPEVTFQFIHRTVNVQAHNLAKEALKRREGAYLVREGRIHSATVPEGRLREHPD